MYGLLHSPVSHLMGALCDALGQTVDLEENDECVLEFDDDIEVVVAHIREMQFLSLRCLITEAARSLDDDELRRSLSLNYTSMPPRYALALDDAIGQLVLVAVIDADHTPPEQFLSILAGFLELAPGLREQFARGDEVSPGEMSVPEVFA